MIALAAPASPAPTPQGPGAAEAEFGTVRDCILSFTGADPDRITIDASLREDLTFDSLDALELAIALEVQHGLDIPEADAESWQTVRDVCATVAPLLAARRHG